MYIRGAITIHSFNYASQKAQAYPHDSRCVQNAIRNKLPHQEFIFKENSYYHIKLKIHSSTAKLNSTLGSQI